MLLTFAFVGVVSAVVNSVTPSTNDINRTNGWAHVDQVSQGIGTTDLQFISTRAFWSCFEYRTDGDTSQILTGENGGNNYNTLVTDGLYPYFCQNNSSSTHTITANSYVEVRMVFGGETDERFDWTRFDVLPTPVQISTPTLLGWNVQGIAPSLENTPVTLACNPSGVFVGPSKNHINQVWTSVTGSNVKYIRRVSSNGGSSWNVLSGMVFNTPSMGGWFSFGSSEEGTYDTEVMAFNDVNDNNIADDGALNISDWSNDCKITYDATAPNLSFSGFRDQTAGGYDNTKAIKACGSTTNSDWIAWEWSLLNPGGSPVTYTYKILAAPIAWAIGYTYNTTGTHYYGNFGGNYGYFQVQVTAADAAGNAGTPVTCDVTYQQPTPIVVPDDTNECKNDGWRSGDWTVHFRNQGDCVSYVQSSIYAVGNRKDNQ